MPERMEIEASAGQFSARNEAGDKAPDELDGGSIEKHMDTGEGGQGWQVVRELLVMPPHIMVCMDVWSKITLFKY